MTTSRFAEAYTRRYGLAIVPLPPRCKRPVSEDWGEHVITDPDAARAYYDEHPDANIGIALGPSRICSLDIDDAEAFDAVAAEFGIDLPALVASTPTIVGTGQRLIFKVPDGIDLEYHSLTWPHRDDPKRRRTVFELRAACTGQARQDVFPPSLHPDTGRAYYWLTRPNGEFPEPPAWLLAIWRDWARLKPQLQAVCPWAAPAPAPALPAEPRQPGSESVIDAWNAAHDVETALERYGYTRAGRRWLSPHSQTKLPGVSVLDGGRVWIHHASDPLCSDESGRPVNAFDLFAHYDHGGDLKKAAKAAAQLLGLPAKARREKPAKAQESTAPVVSGDNTQPALDRPSNFDLWAQFGLVLTDKGSPIMNLDNVVRSIEGDPDLRGRIWYDEFLDAIVTDWQGPRRQWKDADDVLLTLYLQRHVGLSRVGVATCHDAALVAAFHDTRNEAKSWLEALAWDGVERLSNLMSDGFGATQSEYAAAVGRCWIVSMVARVMRPGCKVDTVPVIEGGQGAGKSTALSILGGKWFTECHESVTSKDFYGILQGHMLVEISEMHSFTRAEVERIKGIISCQVDRYRKAYGRNTEDHPRQTVLVCTTNRDDWQRDDTGARRFWPVRCERVNLDWLREHREQLFAEAVSRYRAGEPWWDVPTDAQAEAVEYRRDVDSWESIIANWLVGNDRPTTTDILADCLKLDIGRHDQMVQKRVGRIMRVLGWRSYVAKISGGRSYRAWVREKAQEKAQE